MQLSRVLAWSSGVFRMTFFCAIDSESGIKPLPPVHPGSHRGGGASAKIGRFLFDPTEPPRVPDLMRHTFAILALAAAGLTFAPPAAAQETADAAAAAAPTCAAQGIQRVAVMVPPGQT